MKELNIKSNKNIIQIIGLFVTLLFYIILKFIPKEEGIDLALYTFTYLFGAFIILKENKYEILNTNVLFLVFFTMFVGFSPVFYWIRYNSYASEQYVLILIAFYMFIIGHELYNIKHFNVKEKNIKIEYDRFKNIGIILSIISIISNIIYIYVNKNFLFGSNIESGRIQSLASNGLLIQLCNLGNIRYMFFI